MSESGVSPGSQEEPSSRPGGSLQGMPVVRSRELFCVWADGLDGAVATQPAHAAQQGEPGVFMGLTANDSHLWNMCRAAEWGWRRQDLSEAWVLQPGLHALAFLGSCGDGSHTSFWGNPNHPDM